MSLDPAQIFSVLKVNGEGFGYLDEDKSKSKNSRFLKLTDNVTFMEDQVMVFQT